MEYVKWKLYLIGVQYYIKWKIGLSMAVCSSLGVNAQDCCVLTMNW